MGFEATFGSGGAPGWYGKVSTLGDFASRRLSASTLSALDHWLFRCRGRQPRALGDEWLDLYLASPLQRFVLGPGLLDAAAGTTTMRVGGAGGRAGGWMRPHRTPPIWWFGVLMPSCDNVGRYFPLVVLQPRRRRRWSASASTTSNAGGSARRGSAGDAVGRCRCRALRPCAGGAAAVAGDAR
ncbi:MAG: type VI secretion system-associated protein TagF [Rubrivivax sp.]